MSAPFHVVTVGWNLTLVEGLGKALAARSAHRFSHILHPRHTAQEFRDSGFPGLHFFRDDARTPMPEPDRELLNSLEERGIPTVHNMILGDRVVSRARYEDALGYASCLARRLVELFGELRPSVVIGGYDGVHSGLGLAVARRLGIPWFAMHFSVIPPGLACFCDRMTPAARVPMAPAMDRAQLESLARSSLEQFEQGRLRAHAYIEPPSESVAATIARIPSRIGAVIRTMRNARRRELLRFTDDPGRHSVSEAASRLRRAAAARRDARRMQALASPPATPYVLFGLHRQPEASIDVWAPYFSNQKWIIETLSRSIPPTHKLLVKMHKSDVTNYTAGQLARMRALPGVELVAPFADARAFIDGADLIAAIQGTIGLEAALLGKPVLLFGDSPVAMFPSASRVEAIAELPALIRRKLAESKPTCEEILRAYAAYLAPFASAGHNDWRRQLTEQEIEGFVRLYDRLERHLATAGPDGR